MTYNKKKYISLFIRFLKENNILDKYFMKLNVSKSMNIKLLTQHYNHIMSLPNNPISRKDTIFMMFLINTAEYFTLWRIEPYVLRNDNWCFNSILSKHEENQWRHLSAKFKSLIELYQKFVQEKQIKENKMYEE